MDRIIFGDNQFLGINHKSGNIAERQARNFDSAKTIFDVLRYVNSIGIKSFMFTTHHQLEPVFQMMSKHPEFADFKLIPCIPYAHKYANAITELGFMGAMSKFTPGPRLYAAAKVGWSMLTANPVPIMKLLIDSEMRMLKEHNVEAIFLQNLAVDLLLGLGMEDVLLDFQLHVEKRHGVRAGFITMNHARLHTVLTDKLGIERPMICSCINKIGFRMNPDQRAVESSIEKGTGDTVAMSILASGAIPVEEAVEYALSMSGVTSVLFGASTEKHILETKLLIDRFG